MGDLDVVDVDGWMVLDSRGRPTVAARVRLAGGAVGTASAPAGASVSHVEARERRDGGVRFAGFGVDAAVAAVRGELRAATVGRDAADLAGIDAALRAADGTADLSRLGGNAVVAVSVATALAAAAGTGRPLYALLGAGDRPLLPLPMVNIVSGGAHAGRALDIQDVLVVPLAAGTFAAALEVAVAVRAGTVAVAERRGLPVALVADEGGLGPPLRSNRAALELVVAGIEAAGLTPGRDAALAVDVAANQLRTPTGYRLAVEGRELSAAEWLAEVAGWVADLPVVSVEDPCADDDEPGWRAASAALGGVQLLGDDYLGTQLARLEHAVAAGIGNAVLVKPNQNGTLTGAAAVLRYAQRAGYATVVSARSGDTEDGWLADLAVGWAAGQIKVGSTTRAERTAKWNRLLAIEHELGAHARYAGAAALARGRTTAPPGGPVVSR